MQTPMLFFYNKGYTRKSYKTSALNASSKDTAHSTNERESAGEQRSGGNGQLRLTPPKREREKWDRGDTEKSLSQSSPGTPAKWDHCCCTHKTQRCCLEKTSSSSISSSREPTPQQLWPSFRPAIAATRSSSWPSWLGCTPW